MNESLDEIKKPLELPVKLRTAFPGDDLHLGNFLVGIFRDTWRLRIPNLISYVDREIDLRDVHSRRSQGIVRIMELGERMVGTYSLIAPGTALDESWRENSATLLCLGVDKTFHSVKLMEKLLMDAVQQARLWKIRGICLHIKGGMVQAANIHTSFGFRRDERGDKLVYGTIMEGYCLRLGH